LFVFYTHITILSFLIAVNKVCSFKTKIVCQHCSPQKNWFTNMEER